MKQVHYQVTRDIDRNKWYYYKYMDPSDSDKIIHIYSIGRIEMVAI